MKKKILRKMLLIADGVPENALSPKKYYLFMTTPVLMAFWIIFRMM